MSLEYGIIVAGFFMSLLVYYKYIHRKIMDRVEEGMREAHDSIELIRENIRTKAEVLDSMSHDLSKTEEMFESEFEIISKDVERIREAKAREIEEEFENKRREMEKDALASVETYSLKARNRVVDAAYLIAVEYLKSHASYSQQDKDEIVGRLSESVKSS